MSRRISIKDREAALRAVPPMREMSLTVRVVSAPRIDDRGRFVPAKVSLSMLEFERERELVDALNPRGTWGVSRKPTSGVNVTAAFCGDPPYERSALFERGCRA